MQEGDIMPVGLNEEGLVLLVWIQSRFLPKYLGAEFAHVDRDMPQLGWWWQSLVISQEYSKSMFNHPVLYCGFVLDPLAPPPLLLVKTQLVSVPVLSSSYRRAVSLSWVIPLHMFVKQSCPQQGEGQARAPTQSGSAVPGTKIPSRGQQHKWLSPRQLSTPGAEHFQLRFKSAMELIVFI